MTTPLLERIVNDYASQLNGAFASGVSPAVGGDFPVDSTLNDFGDEIPTLGKFRIRIEDEILIATREGAAASNLKVIERGAENTSAAAHPDNSPVEAVITGSGMDAFVQRLGGYGSARRRGWMADTVDPWLPNVDDDFGNQTCIFELHGEGGLADIIEFQVRTTAAATITTAQIALYYALPGDTGVTRLGSATDIAAIVNSIGWKTVTFSGSPLDLTNEPGARRFVGYHCNATTRAKLRAFDQSTAEFRTNGALGRSGDTLLAASVANGVLAASYAFSGFAALSKRPWFGVR